MVELRVTKYDPALRNEQGHYGCIDEDGNYGTLLDEWTEVGDIGKSFGGKVLTVEDYLVVEAEYISTIQQFMKVAGVEELIVSDLEVNGCKLLPHPLKIECKNTITSIKNGQVVTFEGIPTVVRLILRNAIWCRLNGERSFYVHFGYDYYMYLGYEGDYDTVDQVSTKLFVEKFFSPSWPDDEDDDG